jgi:hypothetical protein
MLPRLLPEHRPKPPSINAVSPLGGTGSEACTCEQIKGSASDSAEVLVRAGESLNAVLFWVVVVCRRCDACSQCCPEAGAADVCKCRKGILGCMKRGLR